MTYNGGFREDTDEELDLDYDYEYLICVEDNAGWVWISYIPDEYTAQRYAKASGNHIVMAVVKQAEPCTHPVDRRRLVAQESPIPRTAPGYSRTEVTYCEECGLVLRTSRVTNALPLETRVEPIDISEVRILRQGGPPGPVPFYRPGHPPKGTPVPTLED